MATLLRMATGALVLAGIGLAGLPAEAGDGRRGWGHGKWHGHHHHHRWRGHWVHPQYGPSYWVPPPVRYHRPPPVLVAPPVVYPPPVFPPPVFPPIVYPPPVIYHPGHPGHYGPRGGVGLGIQIPLW